MEGFCKLELNEFGPVQLYVQDAGPVPVKLSVAPTQIGELLAAVTLGVGFTVIVKVITGPIHVPTYGVTEMVEVTPEAPLFEPVKLEIFPVPLAPRPMEVSVLVQS